MLGYRLQRLFGRDVTDEGNDVAVYLDGKVRALT